jgi:hypothetical protein
VTKKNRGCLIISEFRFVGVRGKQMKTCGLKAKLPNGISPIGGTADLLVCE